MKYQQLFQQCIRIVEGFDNVNPMTDVVTIDDYIVRMTDKYNNAILQEDERQRTLQAISTTGSPKEAKRKQMMETAAGGDAGDGEGQSAKKTVTVKAERPKVLQPDETLFITETVMGVHHHRHMVDCAFQGYRAGLSRNRSDYYVLVVLTYLLVFRFHELGGDTLRLLIDRSASYAKLAEYLTFLTDSDMLDKHVVPKWRTVYDDVYTEEVLVGTILSQKDAIDEGLRNWILVKGTNQKQKEADRQAALAVEVPVKGGARGPGANSSASSKGSRAGGQHQQHPGSAGGARGAEQQYAVTPPVGLKGGSRLFQKTGAQTSSIPPFEVREMMAMEPLVKLPRITDRCTTPEREAVAGAARGEKRSTLQKATKEKNREAEKAIQFRAFSATNRPTNLPRLMQEQQERMAAEVAPRVMNRPGPEEVRARLNQINNTVDVKTTNAALRREELLYAKRAAEEELAFKRMTKELHDDSEFQRWKKEGQMQDEVEREHAIAQRKLDMMMVDEAAKASRRKQENQNKHLKRQLKHEADTVKQRNEKDNARKLKEQQARAKEIKQETEDAGKIRQVVAGENRKIVLEQIEIKQQNELRVAMALELERERKQEMIRNIKEVHAASVALHQEQRDRKKTVKAVDIGELVAMTYEELQDKLRGVKQEHDDLVEKKRLSILAAKDKAAVERSDVQERIFRERQRHLDKKAVERESRRADQAEKERRLRKEDDEKLISLQAKLAEKRDERARFERERKEEDRQRRLAAQLLSADADAVEKAKWLEMQRGAQNAILKAQNDRIVQNAVNRKKEAGVVNLREKNIDTAHTMRMTTLKEKDDMFTSKKQRFEEDTTFDDDVRMQAYANMKQEKKRRAELMLQHSKY